MAVILEHFSNNFLVKEYYCYHCAGSFDIYMSLYFVCMFNMVWFGYWSKFINIWISFLDIFWVLLEYYKLPLAVTQYDKHAHSTIFYKCSTKFTHVFFAIKMTRNSKLYEQIPKTEQKHKFEMLNNICFPAVHRDMHNGW